MIPHILSYPISSHSPTPFDEALNTRFVCSKTTAFDAILGSPEETGNIGFLSETRGSSSLIGRPYVREKDTPRKEVTAAFIPVTPDSIRFYFVFLMWGRDNSEH
jgi:hypothetical protein